MKKKIFFLLLNCFFVSAFAQEKYTISGYVKEAETGEYLIGATVYLQESMQGTSTNQYGFYSLTVKEGNYTIDFSFLGLETQKQKITLKNNKRINVSLNSSSIITDEVVIKMWVTQ